MEAADRKVWQTDLEAFSNRDTMTPLTHDAVRQLYVDQNLEIENLTVQVISMKPVGVPNSGNSPDRWRIIISDGTQFITSMLATQLNYLVQENQIRKHSIIRIPNYTVNMIGVRRVVVLLQVEVVASDYPERIGSPVSCDTADLTPKPAAPKLPNQPEIKADPSQKENKPAQSLLRANLNANGPQSTKPLMSRPQAPGYVPIAGLSPFTNKWKIKARVASKSDIRHWHNARGEGKLFSLTLLDESGSIKATAFNDAVDQLYDRFQEGKVYYVSRGRINIAKKQFNNLPHDYEIMFENTTEVEDCEDETDTPRIQLGKLTPLSSLAELEKDAICDVVAVLKDVGEIGEIVGKQTQKTMIKRDITLVDQSAYSVRMTLWGKAAENFDAPTETIIAFQGVKVGDFQGRNLSMLSSSIMLVNPEIPEAYELRGWYDDQGVNAKIQSHSALGGAGLNRPITEESLKTIAEIKESEIGLSERGDFFTCRATIMYIKSETICYPACPTDRCNKKLLQDGDDEWRCEKCDKVFPAPDYRYLIQMTINDHTGSLWLSGFNEVGQIILSMNANQLQQTQNEDEAEYKKIITEASAKTYDLVFRARQETYNDVPRTKYSVLQISPVDWVNAGLQLAEMLMKTYGS